MVGKTQALSEKAENYRDVKINVQLIKYRGRKLLKIELDLEKHLLAACGQLIPFHHSLLFNLALSLGCELVVSLLNHQKSCSGDIGLCN